MKRVMAVSILLIPIILFALDGGIKTGTVQGDSIWIISGPDSIKIYYENDSLHFHSNDNIVAIHFDKRVIYPYVYAWGSFTGANETISLDADVYAPITNATNDLFTIGGYYGCLVQGDSMVPYTTGEYRYDWDFTWSGGNGKDYTFAIKNDVVLGGAKSQSGSGETNFKTISGATIAILDSGEVIRQVVKSSDGTDVIIVSGTIVMERKR